MNTVPSVLITRKKYGLQIWLSQAILMQYCETLSEGYMRRIRCGNRKGEIIGWQWQYINGTYYYNVDTIPNKKPAMYASCLPTKEELIVLAAQPKEEPTLLVDDVKVFIAQNYQKYLPEYSQHTPQQSNNLARACAMLEWMITYCHETKMDMRELEFFKQSGEIIDELEIKYLPSTAYRNLKYKVMDILGGNLSITESVTLPRAGNTNSLQHKEDIEVISWIYQLRESGANYTNAYIIRKIQAECEKVSKPIPSERWIGEKINEREVQFLTAATRFGSGKYGNPYKASIPTANALFAGDCWEIDATRVNILPHKGDKNKLQYLTIIAVRDVYSGMPVGMSFDVSENRWSVTQALSNAVAFTGYLPYEIRYDRFPGHNSEEVINLFNEFTHMGVKLTVAFKSTGKQRLERWFGSMQHLALQNSPYYYGEGIMSNSKTAHRSKEYMQVARKVASENGWDFDKAISETQYRIEGWVNTPYSEWSKKYKHIPLSPAQLHEQSEKPNIIECSEARHAFLFGLKKTLKIRNYGLIQTTINKEDFTYQITDFNIVSKYSEVICCYNVEDLSRVHIYAPIENVLKLYLGVANEFIPPQLYGTNPEYSRLAKIKAMYREFDDMKKRELEAKKVANGEQFPQLPYGVAAQAVIHPMTVHKSQAEVAESIVTNKHFGFTDSDDDGEGLNINPLTGL